MKLGFLVVVVGGLAACPAPVGSRAPVPSDSTAQCRDYCQNIGLPLESVVIMASNVGCVCDARPPMAGPAPMGPPAMAPTPAPPTSSKGASSTAGGMAAVMMEEAEEQQQHNQQTSTTMMHP
ncbi:MAG: hypothetical protein ABJE66_35140 [Deltaproteobacteria bacterium]